MFGSVKARLENVSRERKIVERCRWHMVGRKIKKTKRETRLARIELKAKPIVFIGCMSTGRIMSARWCVRCALHGS